MQKILLFFLFMIMLCCMAEEATKEQETTKTTEKLVTTQHSLQTSFGLIKYKATTGYLSIKNEQAKATAKIFFIAYQVENGKSRPITFAFNGGPGSSSVWLHLGALGPKRVVMSDEGLATKPPYKLVDNPKSWLLFTDLVFIDPVTTGYSRALKPEDAKKYHSVRGDIKILGEFIRLYLTQNQKWGSPKYLAGESYGTTRAVGLAKHLQDTHGIDLNGLILVSSVLDFGTLRFQEGNDLPYIMFLPSYTATAWYHKKLSASLQKDLETTLEKAKKFALEEYALALLQGNRLSAEKRKYIAEQLSLFTGISQQYIERADLRVTIYQFTKELLRDSNRSIGRLDSRFQGIETSPLGEVFEHDPSYTGILGPYTACFNNYIRQYLKYKNDLPYEILTSKVRPWDWGVDNGYLNIAPELASCLSKTPDLQVFIANGYYDLATPYFATEYTINHLKIDSSLTSNITMGYYNAGHMMYIHMPSLEKLFEDVKKFYTSSKNR